MPVFKDGVYTDDKGYLRISAGPHRGVRVATLVAEGMLGRKLRPDEDVHHEDGDRLNPCWTNLKVLDKHTHGCISAKQHFYVEKVLAERERQAWNSLMKESDETKDTDYGYGTETSDYSEA